MEFAALPLFRNLQSRYLKGVCLDDVLCLGVTERYHESLQVVGHVHMSSSSLARVSSLADDAR